MRFSGALVLLVVAVCTAGRAGAAEPGGYLALVDSGLQRCEQGQWDLALRDFSDASRLDPDDGLAYAGQALCQLAQRQPEAAASLFRRSGETHRCDAVAACGLALSWFEVGRLKTADTWFKKASELDNLLFAPYFYRAVIALCQGRLDDAADGIRRARDLGAPELLLDYLEALRLFSAGRWQAAADGLRQLRPKLVLSTPGLPLPLPLKFVGEPGAPITFLVTEREPLGETVAPRAVAQVTVAEPARMGPLTVLAPLPGDTVAGRIPIRVDLRQPRSYKYVTISIDGQLKGMTNHEPYYVVWDTAGAAEGAHEIVVKAIGGMDAELKVQVNVRNTVGVARSTYDPATYRTAGRRLATMLLHTNPPLSVEKLMVQAYQQQDPEMAVDMYERVLARDASRIDVIEPLLGLYRTQGLALQADKLPEPHRGVPGAKRVALTFDDGPRPEYTQPILSLLRRYKARATFMVVGRMVERYPEWAKAIVKDGHEIGSHTYNHRHLDSLSRAEIIYELIKTKVVLDDAVGGASRFFRPPGGHYNAQVREAAAALGYFPVFWTVNCASYLRLSPQEAAQAIARRTDDGGVLLLHNGADNTLPLLPYLLEILSQEGYRFVTISDILRAPTEAHVAAKGSTYGPLPPSALETYAGTE